MSNIHFFDKDNLPSLNTYKQISEFLFEHLDQYGDPRADIEKAMNYALARDGKPGGSITITTVDDEVVCGIVINKTGMKGYIPENILVYVATAQSQRGKGIGKRMMQYVIEKTEGDIALHVEPDNPAKNLYEKLGFTNRYLEMRLKKEA